MAKKSEKNVDFQNMSISDLQKTCNGLKEEIRQMRFDRVLGTNFNLVSFRSSKKKLAQVMTAMSLKKLGGQSE